ncbi:MAG: hypothetical protein MI923_30755 [Phycisphaerales bacterium]|nr:hypothetical protein [Phycisphaerales bacterium]
MGTAVTVTTDLIFSTKISSTAKALQMDARAVSNADALAAVLEESDVSVVMVDMSLGEKAGEALRCAAGHARSPATVAFYSHVQAELREAAEVAGAQHVMPRSQFSEQLPVLLAKYGDRDDGSA